MRGVQRRWPLLAAVLGLALAVVDESGKYRVGGDLAEFAPPPPTDADKAAATDLTKEPIEKIFRLLMYELLREEKRPPEKRLGVGEFQLATELPCQERLLYLLQQASQLAADASAVHLNITGTAGLFWLLHKYPDEHSWAWLIGISHYRLLTKLSQYFTQLMAFTVDDDGSCMSLDLRSSYMNAIQTWKRLHSDYVALLWNGIAFGILGDVTAWREIDEETDEVESGPGGPPPNVSWSENLIFGNMWMSGVCKFLEAHSQEVNDGVFQEVARMRQGVVPQGDAMTWRRRHNGRLSSFEYLYRQAFDGWALDKGLLRAVLRHALRPEYDASPLRSVADFGAGGGQYSEWLNETGLVEALAFDGVIGAHGITGGRVAEVDLAKRRDLGRKFDWVLCLDVGAYMPPDHVTNLLWNVREHAIQGLVLSWPADRATHWHVNPLPEAEVVALVERETGFHRDAELTARLRAGCEHNHLAESVVAFRALG